MDIKIICYEKCTTCKRAKKWLDANGIVFDERDIKTQNPAEDELREWTVRSGLPLRRFYNTSGQLYRQMELAKKKDSMSEDEQYALLATDGMLVKRPIVLADDKVLVGFKEAQWEDALLK